MSAKTHSQLTKDLNESVKQLLGKHVKVLLKNVVKLETKGDKTENRVLVFSPFRIFILTAKVPTRIDCHFHYLEIQALESKRGNHLSITISDKTYSFITGEDSTSSQEVDSMISALAMAIKHVFPTVPLQYILRKIDVIPTTRLQSIFDNELNSLSAQSPTRSNASGACAGFSTQYACLCDYHSMPYRDEVAWDVDTIYFAHDTREICLKDFDHLDQKDLVPIISALEYNTWFTSLRVNVKSDVSSIGDIVGYGNSCSSFSSSQNMLTSPIRLNADVAERILHIMKKSLSLEQLHLENLGLKTDFVHKLSLALIANQLTPLHTIDLSYNQVEDKGAMHLSGPIARVPKGLVKLRLSHCALTAKGVNQLAHAMSLNKSMHSSLTYLDLSGNNLKDDINNLYNFLAQPNAISHLDISSTETTLESLFGALLRGCGTNLQFLNVSKNPFSAKKSKEVPPSFKQFFTSTLSLKHLNMAYCKLPLEALKNLLLGLACNESTSEMHLDLSNNSLGVHGAHVIESCIHGVRCIASFDISENNMDVELSSVITAISKNKSIKHLYMGKNMNNMKAKHINCIMDALVQMIQEEDCVLQSLYIPDSKLKGDVHNFINALGSNNCLKKIDIGGNMMGDSGARLLAKALQINTRLQTIILDRNGITLQGLADIAYAMQKNFSLKHIPCPAYDLSICMKTNGERADFLWRTIQNALYRNVSPKTYNNLNGQAFRLQQGFLLLSSTQQQIDRLVIQIQETVKALTAEVHTVSLCAPNNNNNDLSSAAMLATATALLQDADNSKTLLSRLHEVIQRRDKDSSNNEIEMKMKLVSDDLHNAVNNYMQSSLECMLACANDQCPLILNNDRFRKELRLICSKKIQIPENFIRQSLLDHAASEILSRVSEINFTIAANLSERITDEVVEQLSRCQRSLLGVAPSHYLPHHVSPFGSSDSEAPSSLDSTTRSFIDQSPMATPHLSIKRKSLHGLRKMRPKSVVDSVGDGLSSEDDFITLPNSLHDFATATQTANGHHRHSVEESLDSVSELSENALQQLQHLVKGRPRRVKVHAPTRPVKLGMKLSSEDGGVFSTVPDELGEGLENFFSRPGSVTPITTPTVVSPTSEECSSLSFQTQAIGSSSPAPRSNNSTSGETTPVLNYDRKIKTERNSPLPKIIGFRRADTTDGNDTTDNAMLRSKSTESVHSNSALRQRSPIVNDLSTSPLYKLRSAATTAENGFVAVKPDLPKSPILKSVSKDESKSNESIGKSLVKIAKPTVIATTPASAKPRPWSVSSASSSEPRKSSSEFQLLSSDGSVTTPSTGNTPDSGDALDEEVKNITTSITRKSSNAEKVTEKELKTKKSEDPRPIPAPRKFIFGKTTNKAKVAFACDTKLNQEVTTSKITGSIIKNNKPMSKSILDQCSYFVCDNNNSDTFISGDSIDV